MVNPGHHLNISVDEEDNRFLECAQTARAHFLVTGNRKHFPNRIDETRIVAPREFLNEIGF
jgi:predicted nucleic acid-binding protein